MTAGVPRNGREVRAVLRSLGASPSRRLGQNFLTDPRVVERVAAAAAPAPADLVLEIGPGLGVLTERLAAAGSRVVAVEIDRALAAFLRGTFSAEGRVRIVEGDALDGRGDLSPALLRALEEAGGRAEGRLLVAANLPYSAATPILLSLLLLPEPPDDIVVMVQKEVADRIRAAPSTAAYGPLSVLVQAVARPPPVSPARGGPPPPARRGGAGGGRGPRPPARRPAAGDLDALRTVVHAAFSQRRKTLGNALSRAGLCSPADLAGAGFDPARRGEALSPQEFVRLSAAIASLASGGRGGEDPGPSP